MGQILKIGSLFQNYDFLKMGHFFENGAFFSKNGSNFEKWVKIEKLKCASYVREIRVKCT